MHAGAGVAGRGYLRWPGILLFGLSLPSPLDADDTKPGAAAAAQQTSRVRSRRRCNGERWPNRRPACCSLVDPRSRRLILRGTAPGNTQNCRIVFPPACDLELDRGRNRAFAVVFLRCRVPCADAADAVVAAALAAAGCLLSRPSTAEHAASRLAF